MIKQFKSNTFGILGIGISNKAVLEFFIKNNFQFILWDDNKESLKKLQNTTFKQYNLNIRTLIRHPTDNEWKSLDYLIMSPGIPLTHPKPHKIIDTIQNTKVKIICDIELFYLLHPNNKYIGITGTNGKSTITSLTHHILHTVSNKAVIAGNIGEPIFNLNKTQDQIIILEISSYQIDLLDKIRFHISALSNITPDHLDRHGSFKNYINIKYKLISKLNNGISIINIDNTINQSLYLKLKKTKNDLYPTSTTKHLKEGISYIDSTIVDNIKNYKIKVPQNKYLLGKHNAENLVISYVLSQCAENLTTTQFEHAIASFIGLKHRMQFVAKYKNITFINDSKGTNAVSTLHAIQSYENIYWILGGQAKEGGIQSLVKNCNNIKLAFLIGESRHDFSTTLTKASITHFVHEHLKDAFYDAVSKALKTQEHITILLSPACASFDQWDNFAKRGEAFINLVTNLMNK